MARKRKRKEAGASSGEEPAAPRQERQRFTPVDVQEKVFRLAFRGYSERDVDEFLDQITEDLAALHEENKRLREQLAETGGDSAGIEDAQRQAQAIVRQAREHAARLVEDAEARTATGDVEADVPGLPTSFLLRERQFLQQMAGLIQDHARRLKEEARRASSAPPAQEVPEPAMDAEPATQEAPEAVAPSPAERPSAEPQSAAPPAEAEAAATTAAPSPEPVPESPEEQTAPWIRQEQGSTEDRENPDPLLSAWERAFTAEASDEGPPGEAALYPSDARKEEEPSLRELFWGDEG